MTKNIFLALLLSLPVTLVLTIFYVFYPVISAILGILWRQTFSSSAESNGVFAVAGGVSSSFLTVFLVVASILFLIIFLLLQKRSTARLQDSGTPRP
jgi:hypothetical protein